MNQFGSLMNKKFLYLPFTFVPKYLLSFVENPESNLSNYFLPFKSIKLQIIKSNKFRTYLISDNSIPTSSWSRIKQIEFELVFIKYFEHFLPFWINQITNFQNDLISNEFQFDSIPSLRLSKRDLKES